MPKHVGSFTEYRKVKKNEAIRMYKEAISTKLVGNNKALLLNKAKNPEKHFKTYSDMKKNQDRQNLEGPPKFTCMDPNHYYKTNNETIVNQNDMLDHSYNHMFD